MKSTDKDSLTLRLRLACVGHPTAKIPWPHRILHEAADEIADLTAKLAESDKLSAEYVARTDAGLDALSAKNDELRAKLAEADSKISAARLMADFAKGAIHDAIATEDGLDGETGHRVMCIITEWQEHGTFDKTLCEHMTSFEKFSAQAIDEDALGEIQSLQRKLAEAERERDAASFDKARMLDERQIFLKGLDELRAEVARLKETAPDKNAESVRARLMRRSVVGLEKYGVTTERSDLSMLDWLQHLQDELLDGSVYVEKLKGEVEARESAEARLTALRQDVEEVVEDEGFHITTSGADRLIAALAKSGEP